MDRELELLFFDDVFIDHSLKFVVEGCDNSVPRWQCLRKQRSCDPRLPIDPLEEEHC